MSATLSEMNSIEVATTSPVDPAGSDGSSVRQRGSRLARSCLCLRRNLFVLLLLLSLLLSVGIGCFIKFATELTFTAKELVYISFPGTLFLNMLKMVIVPLVLSSLVAGMSSLDKRTSGILGIKALTYYIAATLFAVTLGTLMVMSIQPGNRQRSVGIKSSQSAENVNTADVLLDLLRNMFPPNLVEACFRTYKTVQPPSLVNADNQSHATDVTPLPQETSTTGSTSEPEAVPETGYVDQSNLLGLVVFSCAFGVVLGRMGPEGEPLRALANSFMETILSLVRCIIWLSPLGIFFLILGKILETDDWVTVFSQIGLYSATVISGLLIHGLLVLPLIFLVLTRRNPFSFIKGVSSALMTTFATAASSATLPLFINSLEKNNGMDKRVTRFMLPIGASINKDGTALYVVVAAIFIAQVNGVELNAGFVLTVGVAASLTSIATAGVPQGGLVTLIIVLNAVGLPAEDVTLIIVIEWLVERVRTTVNVASGSFGVGIVHYRSQARLAALDNFQEHVNEAFAKSDTEARHPHHEVSNTKL